MSTAGAEPFRTMNVPTTSECLALIDRYEMLPNIREHSFVVARVAETIVNRLDLPGNSGCILPEVELVRAGALLHDIAKTKCLGGDCDHADEGGCICAELGYPEIATIVREHVILSDFVSETCRRGTFRAKEIVYYSDKRVMHDKIVSLEERLDYIIDHYSRGSDSIKQRIRDNFALCMELESCIFSFLPFTPEQLVRQVDTIPYDTGPAAGYGAH